MVTTITTLFSGCEGVSAGARLAGVIHLGGFDFDDDIAGIARRNGFNVQTADVLGVDPTILQVPDILHASPVCTRASVANRSAALNEDGTKEDKLDIEFGYKIASFIDVMQPRIFTLENVYQYRNFKAFKIICAALDRNSYFWDYDNLNAANYGVPQSRRRLVLRAMRGSLLPMLPQPTRHIGWYESIEDLIPGLPTAWHGKKNQPCEWDALGRLCRQTEGICQGHFAEWQLERLPEYIKGNLLGIINGEFSDYVLAIDPAATVVANHSVNKYRAFILDCQNGAEGGVTLRQSHAPAFTITSGKGNRQPVREDMFNTDNADRDLSIIDGETPSLTIGCRLRNSPRAWLSQGRVVTMTYQALARFQSFPDSYRWTTNPALNCKAIGNSVPPLLYQRIIEPMAGLL